MVTAVQLYNTFILIIFQNDIMALTNITNITFTNIITIYHSCRTPSTSPPPHPCLPLNLCSVEGIVEIVDPKGLLSPQPDLLSGGPVMVGNLDPRSSLHRNILGLALLPLILDA
jgi:hypothetical protein